MENPKDIQTIAERLSDENITVRLAAAQAVEQCLWTAKGESVTLARIALEQRILIESNPTVRGELYAAMGSLQYGAGDDFGRIEGTLRTPFMPSPMLDAWLQALQGLEVFVRRNPDHALDVTTLKRVRELATDGVLKIPPVGEPPFADPVLTALQIEQDIEEADTNAIQRAAVYRCPNKPPTCGWQIRLIGVQMLDPVDGVYSSAVSRDLHDDVYQVRYEALTKAAIAGNTSGTCGTEIDAFADRAPQVVLHAIELLNPRCAEHDDLIAKLRGWIESLDDPINDKRWQIPVAALRTLVKFDPDAAHKIASTVAVTHRVWQVRLAGVRIADELVDEDLLIRLTGHDADVPIGFKRRTSEPKRWQNTLRPHQQHCAAGCGDRGPLINRLSTSDHGREPAGLEQTA